MRISVVLILGLSLAACGTTQSASSGAAPSAARPASREQWVERARQVRAGMKRREVDAILPPMPGSLRGGGISGGQLTEMIEVAGGVSVQVVYDADVARGRFEVTRGSTILVMDTAGGAADIVVPVGAPR